jgi:RimJ/RimL family protein N-acetyltransferase
MFRPDYPIVTPRLLLRPYRADDLDDLYAIQSREDVNRYLYWSPRSRREVADVITTRTAMGTLEGEGDILVLAVELREAGTVIGDVNLAWQSEEHRQGEFGFVFHPDHHGRGYAGEAAVEMLRLGFDGLGLHRIIGRADGRNAASARLMEKLGLRREAHFVQNEWVKGEWTDEVVYAMLASEWADR